MKKFVTLFLKKKEKYVFNYSSILQSVRNNILNIYSFKVFEHVF